jgi:hypothetical protein
VVDLNDQRFASRQRVWQGLRWLAAELRPPSAYLPGGSRKAQVWLRFAKRRRGRPGRSSAAADARWLG